MNLFVFIALMLTGGFFVASIVTQRVIQTLQAELKVEKMRAEEKRFSIKVLAGGLESRIESMLDALQEKPNRGERRGN